MVVDAVKDPKVVVGVFAGIPEGAWDVELTEYIRNNPINPEDKVVVIATVRSLVGNPGKYLRVRSYYKRFGMDRADYKSFFGIESSSYILLLKKDEAKEIYDLVSGIDSVIAVRDPVPLNPSMLPNYKYNFNQFEFDALVAQLEGLLKVGG